MSTRLSSADTAWLHMDRPTNLMVINSVLLFDEPVDWERLKQTTQRRLVDRYPRFRQRVVESHLPLRAPKWEDDPEFALEHHMHHLALPAPGDAAALQELVGDLMMMPLDRNRPLWQTYMVDGFGDGAAMITRMHHCIADGIALARVMLSLTDSEPDAPIEPDRRRTLAVGLERAAVEHCRLGRTSPGARRPSRVDRLPASRRDRAPPAARETTGGCRRPRRQHRAAPAAHVRRRCNGDQGRPRGQPPGRVERRDLAGRDQANCACPQGDRQRRAAGGGCRGPAPLPPGQRQPGRRDPGDGPVQLASARPARPA